MIKITSEDTARRALAYWPMITLVAKGMKLDAWLLAGLIAQESSGYNWAARPEPYYKWLFGQRTSDLPLLKRLLPRWRTPEQDYYMQRVSYGLCQVMGAVARELGLSGYLTRLCDPYVGIFYGAKHLAAKIKRADGDVDRGLLLYNGGGDKEYPSKVREWSSAICALGTSLGLHAESTDKANKEVDDGDVDRQETQGDEG